jgi:hypothetical protein
MPGAADLVVQVLQPPFGYQVALQLPALVSSVREGNCRQFYFANFMVVSATRQKEDRGSDTIATHSRAGRAGDLLSHCSD